MAGSLPQRALRASQGSGTQRWPNRRCCRRPPQDSLGALGLECGNRRSWSRAHRTSAQLRRIFAGSAGLGGHRPALPESWLMICMPLIVAALVAATTSAARAAAPEIPWPGYAPKMFRWDEDYRSLREQTERSFFPLRLKYIPL